MSVFFVLVNGIRMSKAAHTMVSLASNLQVAATLLALVAITCFGAFGTIFSTARFYSAAPGFSIAFSIAFSIKVSIGFSTAL